jgi:hypothetical protein
MGIMLKKLFGALSVEQGRDDNRPHGHSGTLDPWAAPADSRVAHNMGMSNCGHSTTLADSFCADNLACRLIPSAGTTTTLEFVVRWERSSCLT